MLKGVRINIAQWLDSSVDAGPLDTDRPYAIAWFRCIPLFAMHLMCLGVIWVGWSWTAVLVAILLYTVRGIAITGFYHRYFSHRTFETSRVVQFLGGAIGTSSVQKGPLWWAAHHRLHHRYSDQPGDPHSPRQDGFFWSHIGWIMGKRSFATQWGEVPDLVKFPELVLLTRFDLVLPVLLAIATYVLGYGLNTAWPALGTSGMQMLVWGFFISTVLLLHGTLMVNSLAHVFGTQRFKTNDDSRNNPLIALMVFGEGWHNNHHQFPGVARQGIYWYEIDLTYYTLKAMSFLGLIWELREIPASRLVAKVSEARSMAMSGETAASGSPSP